MNFLAWQGLCHTWQLIIRLDWLSVLAATEKTGFWKQFSMCSDKLDSRRCCRMSGVTFLFYRHSVQRNNVRRRPNVLGYWIILYLYIKLSYFIYCSFAYL